MHVHIRSQSSIVTMCGSYCQVTAKRLGKLSGTINATATVCIRACVAFAISTVAIAAITLDKTAVLDPRTFNEKLSTLAAFPTRGHAHCATAAQNGTTAWLAREFNRPFVANQASVIHPSSPSSAKSIFHHAPQSVLAPTRVLQHGHMRYFVSRSDHMDNRW